MTQATSFTNHILLEYHKEIESMNDEDRKQFDYIMKSFAESDKRMRSPILYFIKDNPAFTCYIGMFLSGLVFLHRLIDMIFNSFFDVLDPLMLVCLTILSTFIVARFFVGEDED